MIENYHSYYDTENLDYVLKYFYRIVQKEKTKEIELVNPEKLSKEKLAIFYIVLNFLTGTDYPIEVLEEKVYIKVKQETDIHKRIKDELKKHNIHIAKTDILIINE